MICFRGNRRYRFALFFAFRSVFPPRRSVFRSRLLPLSDLRSGIYFIFTSPLISGSPFSENQIWYRKMRFRCALFPVFFKMFALSTSDCLSCKILKTRNVVGIIPSFFSGYHISFILGELSISPIVSTPPPPPPPPPPPTTTTTPPPEKVCAEKHLKSRPVAQFAQPESISLVPIAKSFVLLMLTRHFAVSPFRLGFQFD